MSDYNSLVASCHTTCAQSSVDPLQNKFLLSNVGLGLGIGLAATSAILLGISFGVGDKTEVRVTPRAGGGVTELALKF